VVVNDGMPQECLRISRLNIAKKKIRNGEKALVKDLRGSGPIHITYTLIIHNTVSSSACISHNEKKSSPCLARLPRLQ
jgi:hypothetical protein